MEKVKTNIDRIIEGLHIVTGIQKEVLSNYAEDYNICDIIDHPMTIGVSDHQYDKLIKLKDFINSYHYLRENEAENRIEINSSPLAGKYFVSQIAYYREREIILCAFVDAKFHIISCEKIAQGTVNESALYPREVLKRAMQLDCAGIFLCHNHPGGSTAPSPADKSITQKMQSIFEPLGIKLYDHFIVADNRYLSMKEEGYLGGQVKSAIREDYMPVSLETQECELEYE
jgi:DNA repair protein RadC